MLKYLVCANNFSMLMFLVLYLGDIVILCFDKKIINIFFQIFFYICLN